MLAFLFITCDKPLQTFLKEKGKLNLTEMTQGAENFVEVHGYEMNVSETKQNRWKKSKTVGTDKGGQNVTSANTVICGYCNMNGHRAENCRRQTDCRPMRSDVICFKCGKHGHSFLVQIQMTNVHIVTNHNSFCDDQSMCTDSRPHNCDESLGDGEVKLACGCILSVVALAFSREGERKLKCSCAGMTPCGVGSVNGHKVNVMKDTASVSGRSRTVDWKS